MKKILELKIRNQKIIKYKYFNNLDIEADTFFIPLSPPILSEIIPANIYIKRIIKQNGDEIRSFHLIK